MHCSYRIELWLRLSFFVHVTSLACPSHSHPPRTPTPLPPILDPNAFATAAAIATIVVENCVGVCYYLFCVFWCFFLYFCEKKKLPCFAFLFLVFYHAFCVFLVR